MSDNKGITMIESLIAVFLTSFVIIGLMTMQPLAWQAGAKADQLGGATEIMQRELETLENHVMRGTLPIPAAKVNVPVQEGKVVFSLNSSITDLTLNKFMIHVQVTWTGNTTGVKSSMIATRQMGFNSVEDHF